MSPSAVKEERRRHDVWMDYAVNLIGASLAGSRQPDLGWREVQAGGVGNWVGLTAAIPDFQTRKSVDVGSDVDVSVNAAKACCIPPCW